MVIKVEILTQRRVLSCNRVFHAAQYMTVANKSKKLLTEQF